MMRFVEQNLEQVRAGLLDMAGRVEQMIADSYRALAERDSALAEAVILADPTVDNLEKKIDEDCLVLLALQEPKAIDFRNIIAIQKMVGELERMGDSAVNIAQGVLRLNREARLESGGGAHLGILADIARRMVRDALDAFVRKDARLAREVCERDDEADAIYHRVFEELVALMRASSGNVERALHLLLASRNLERIADHATNIAEDVIFYLEAADVRHSHPPSAMRALSDAGAGREPPGGLPRP
jgi:phosphate transport system protein